MWDLIGTHLVSIQQPMSSTDPTKVAPVRKRSSSFRRMATTRSTGALKREDSSDEGDLQYSLKTHVNIQKVLRFAQEYHGFRSLFISLFMATCFGLISSYHFEFPADAFTQAAVMEQWTATSRSGRSIWEIKSLEEGGQYVTDWLAENIEDSLAKGETDTILMKDQYRVVAYHIVVMHNDAADMYQNRTARPDEVCESTFYEDGGLPCTSVWSYRRDMNEADYAQYTTWDKDMPASLKQKLRPNATSTNLKDALRDLKALSREPEHWLTSRSRPWEDDVANEGNRKTSSILEGAPYNIPKRGSSTPAFLYIYMVYDTDATAYKTSEDSSRRIIALTALSMQFPVIEAGSFFYANPVATFYANRISETGFYDQSWEYGRRLPIEVRNVILRAFFPVDFLFVVCFCVCFFLFLCLIIIIHYKKASLADPFPSRTRTPSHVCTIT